MELVNAFLILADISGYTKFTRLHKLSLLHAEFIISELLESIIDSTIAPVTLNEIEGDSAFFSAVSDDSPQMAREIFTQSLALCDVFNRKEGELLRCATRTCQFSRNT